MYRKTYEVIGYTYEADIHCPSCAKLRFGSELDNPATEDREGNPVHPVFLGDEFETTPCCGDCLEELDY